MESARHQLDQLLCGSHLDLRGSVLEELDAVSGLEVALGDGTHASRSPLSNRHDPSLARLVFLRRLGVPSKRDTFSSFCAEESSTDYFFFFFFFPFNLTYSRWTSSLPSCLWSLRVFPSLPGPRLTIFLSRCKFSTLTTRQPMVEFYLLTFPRFPLRKKEHKSCFGKNRTHDFRTSRCAGYLLDHSGDEDFS